MRQVKSRGLGWDPPTPNHEEKQIHGEPDCGDPQGADAGMKVADVCRNHGISQPIYYNCKSRYGGLGISELNRIGDIEAEHSKLKRMYADLAMENDALKELIEKKL